MDRIVSITAEEIGNGKVPADLVAAPLASLDHASSQNAPQGGIALAGGDVSPEAGGAARRAVSGAAIAPLAANTARHECSPDYAGVLFSTPTFRVAIDRDGIQWLVQTRTAGNNAPRPWKAQSFCLTRIGLELVVSRAEYRDIPGLKDFVAAQPKLAKHSAIPGAKQ
jgi:hypothetical protein